MPVSIHDVARLAGVSSATVSRVLADKPHVRPELRERVLSAVRTLGYQPNRVARSLRVQRTNIIGLTISDIQNPFFTALVRGVEDVAYAAGYAVFLCNSDEDPAKEQMYLDLMRAERVAGVVVTPTSHTLGASEQLLEAGVPLVTVDRRLSDNRIDTVVIDNVAAAYALTKHLLEDGYRRIGAILPSMTITTARERKDGYVKALAEHDLTADPSLVRSGAPTSEEGYRLTKELIEHPDRPEALFTANNMLTIGALKAISDHKLSIPDDIALVTFDDLDWMAAFSTLSLTTMKQPTYELGKIAATLLLERLAQPSRPPREVVLHPELRVGQSCARHHDAPQRVAEELAAGATGTDGAPEPQKGGSRM